MVKIYDLNSVSLNESIEKTEDVGKSQDTGSVQDESSKSQTSETTTVEVDDSASDASTEEDEGSDNQVEISEQPAVTTDVIHVTDSTHTTVMKGCTIVNNYPPPPCVDEFNEKHVVPIIKGTIEQATKKKNTITTAIACGVALTLILVIVLTVVLLTKIKPPEVLSYPEIPRDDTFSDDGNTPPGIAMVSRKKCSVPSVPKYTNLKNLTVYPPEMVFISHTTTSECYNEEECCYRVNSIHSGHVNGAGFSDIGGTFYVGSDGKVYEGREWYKEGAHTKGFNCKSYGISLIGNFMSKPPVEKQLSAVQNLLNQLVERKYLSANYSLYAHSDASNTESPGSSVTEQIDKWSHRSKILPARCT